MISSFTRVQTVCVRQCWARLTEQLGSQHEWGMGQQLQQTTEKHSHAHADSHTSQPCAIRSWNSYTPAGKAYSHKQTDGLVELWSVCVSTQFIAAKLIKAQFDQGCMYWKILTLQSFNCYIFRHIIIFCQHTHGISGDNRYVYFPKHFIKWSLKNLVYCV